MTPMDKVQSSPWSMPAAPPWGAHPRDPNAELHLCYASVTLMRQDAASGTTTRESLSCTASSAVRSRCTSFTLEHRHGELPVLHRFPYAWLGSASPASGGIL